jgi:F-type H+-transporting ATPase subunit b
MEQLGIEPKLLLAQIINFAIIIFVLSKLLFKPILGMLDKRRKEIEDGLALTEKMRVEEEKMSVKRAKMIEESRKEARTIIDEARARAHDEEKEIVAHAHDEAQEIIEKGKLEAQRVKGEMEKDVRGQAVTLAEAMASKLLTGVLSSDDQHKILRSHLKELDHV